MIELKFPLQIDRFGRFSSSTSSTEIWTQRVIAVLSTQLGSRVMRSEFGSGIETSIFDHQTSVASTAEGYVRGALTKHLPELILNQINSFSDEETGVVTLEVYFSLPNREQSSTIVSINQDALVSYQELNFTEGTV